MTKMTGISVREGSVLKDGVNIKVFSVFDIVTQLEGVPRDLDLSETRGMIHGHEYKVTSKDFLTEGFKHTEIATDVSGIKEILNRYATDITYRSGYNKVTELYKNILKEEEQRMADELNAVSFVGKDGKVWVKVAYVDLKIHGRTNNLTKQQIEKHNKKSAKGTEVELRESKFFIEGDTRKYYRTAVAVSLSGLKLCLTFFPETQREKLGGLINTIENYKNYLVTEDDRNKTIEKFERDQDEIRKEKSEQRNKLAENTAQTVPEQHKLPQDLEAVLDLIREALSDAIKNETEDSDEISELRDQLETRTKQYDNVTRELVKYKNDYESLKQENSELKKKLEKLEKIEKMFIK